MPPLEPPAQSPLAAEPPLILPASVPAAHAGAPTPTSVVRTASAPRAATPATGFRWGHELLRLALALPLVVLGVYLAGLATRYQERRERDHRATQLRAALRREVVDVGAGVTAAHQRLGAILVRLDSAAHAGGPTPPRWPVSDIAAPRPHMWQTATQSGALELLDVATAWRLSEFYDELATETEALRRLEALSERATVPAAGAAAREYRLAPGAAPPRPDTYATAVDELHEATGRLAVRADSLVLLLAPPGRR
ncbi:MAG TPA: hypothetical protein VF048_10585 [Gemmatimonadaceae bacterium]